MRARQIIDYWLDNPGVRMTGEELSRELGFDGPQAVAGILGSIGRRAVAVKRHLPYRYEWDPVRAGSYWMEPDLVDLFRRARDEAPR